MLLLFHISRISQTGVIHVQDADVKMYEGLFQVLQVIIAIEFNRFFQC